MRINIFYALVFSVLLIASGQPSFAEDGGVSQVVATDMQKTEVVKGQESKNQAPSTNKAAGIKEREYSSIFFTYWQHQAIMDAKDSRGHVRPPTPEELAALKNGAEEDIKPDPGPRELALGGIVFKGKDDWTIWLNEQRITPKAIPKEIIDLQVFKDYVEVKWHDEFTGRIYPVRLRSHERFNLDMRIYLPG